MGAVDSTPSAAGCARVTVGAEGPVEPDPRWLRVAQSIHSSGPSVAPVLVDVLILTAAGGLLGLRPATLAALALAVPAALYMGRHYVPRSPLETQGFSWYPQHLMPGYTVGLAALLLVAGDPGRVGIAITGATGFGALLGVRVVTWAVISTARHRGRGLRRTAILGATAPATRVAEKLLAYPEAGLLPIMVLSPAWNPAPEPSLGPADLAVALRTEEIRQLIVIPAGDPEQELGQYLDSVDHLDVALVPPMAELFLAQGRRVAQVGGLPLLPLGRWARPAMTQPGKRLFDLTVASVLLALLAPVLLSAALAIKLDDGGPVIFRQRRVGHRGRTFDILKFRSMTVGAEHRLIDLTARNSTDGLLFKVPDDPRVTAVGRWLRRLSIDELPQLLNVLRGDMSLVGPRPLAVSPDSFGPVDQRRHVVPPGVTGYWQVTGGNGLTYREMIKLDLAYIQSWSLWLDILLLLKTIPALTRRKGPW